MSSTDDNVMAVVGATGQQGIGVVRALRHAGQFTVRALSRHPGLNPGLGDEVVEADLNRPETLPAAFWSAHGVFLVTNFWEKGTDEGGQAARRSFTRPVQASFGLRLVGIVWIEAPIMNVLRCAGHPNVEASA
jgi:uncharacterized protein YbjT (DUF2867 family)